jgi:hypothetical protein
MANIGKYTPRLERLERFADLLDESIRIPGIGYRVGYDAVIGLIPGVGDVAGLAVSTYIVLEAARFRIPATTLLRMITNVALEALIGAIPLVGDVFDAVYKANLRNVRLLRRSLENRSIQPADDRRFFLSLIIIPLLIGALILALLIYVLSAVF